MTNINKFDLQFFADEVAEEAPKEPAKVEKEEEQVKPNKEAETSDKEATDPVKRYTDEEVDRIISQKFAKWAKDKEEEVKEAEKLAKMDSEQKAEYEFTKMKARLEELETENTLTEMSKVARSMLNDSGIVANDDVVNMLITTDAEKTKSNINGFVELFNQTVDKAVTDKLKGKTPPRIESTKEATDVWSSISAKYKKKK